MQYPSNWSILINLIFAITGKSICLILWLMIFFNPLLSWELKMQLCISKKSWLSTHHKLGWSMLPKYFFDIIYISFGTAFYTTFLSGNATLSNCVHGLSCLSIKSMENKLHPKWVIQAADFYCKFSCNTLHTVTSNLYVTTYLNTREEH